MNSRNITLGDNTLVQITYDTNDGILYFSSTNPTFFYVVGNDFSLNIGPFITNNISSLASLMDLIYQNRQPV